VTTGRRIALLGAGVAAEVAAAGTVFAVAAGVSWPTGMYWAVVTATTVGYGDVTPHGAWARTVAIVVMLTVIPLLGALFAALTSMHIGKHVRGAEERIHARLDEDHQDLKAHITREAGR
jgi:voltage-gated potassium channel